MICVRHSVAHGPAKDQRADYRANHAHQGHLPACDPARHLQLRRQSAPQRPRRRSPSSRSAGMRAGVARPRQQQRSPPQSSARLCNSWCAPLRYDLPSSQHHHRSPPASEDDISGIPWQQGKRKITARPLFPCAIATRMLWLAHQRRRHRTPRHGSAASARRAWQPGAPDAP